MTIIETIQKRGGLVYGRCKIIYVISWITE